jgi:hypothetical protein
MASYDGGRVQAALSVWPRLSRENDYRTPRRGLDPPRRSQHVVLTPTAPNSCSPGGCSTRSPSTRLTNHASCAASPSERVSRRLRT